MPEFPQITDGLVGAPVLALAGCELRSTGSTKARLARATIVAARRLRIVTTTLSRARTFFIERLPGKADSAAAASWVIKHCKSLYNHSTWSVKLPDHSTRLPYHRG